MFNPSLVLLGFVLVLALGISLPFLIKNERNRRY